MKKYEPNFSKLHALLMGRQEPYATTFAKALEVFIDGPLKCFSDRTTISTKKRVICFNVNYQNSIYKDIAVACISTYYVNTVLVNSLQTFNYWCYLTNINEIFNQYMIYISDDIWSRVHGCGGIVTGVATQIPFYKKEDYNYIFLKKIMDCVGYVYIHQSVMEGIESLSVFDSYREELKKYVLEYGNAWLYLGVKGFVIEPVQ